MTVFKTNMEVVHKEPISGATQPSKTKQSLLLVPDHQGTNFVEVLQVSDLPFCSKACWITELPREVLANTITFACW